MPLNNIGMFLAVALIAFWMLAGGIGHLVKPEVFYPIVPDFLPKKEVVLITGIPEILIGLGILIPKTRALAGLAFAILCAAFMPLHIWDLFRESPAITPQSAAIVRVALQVLLIAVGLYVFRAAKRA